MKEIFSPGTKIILHARNLHLHSQVQKFEILGGVNVMTLSNGWKLFSFQDSPPDHWLRIDSKLNDKRMRVTKEES